MTNESYNKRFSPDLSVIIVNYNTAELLKQCLASISDEKVNMEIIVVDNASTDNSAQVVRSQFNHVHLYVNDMNLGFGKANNLGIKMASGRYLLLLNPDTKVVPGAFESMVRYMDLHPAIGLAGAKILNPDNSLQPSIEHRYPGQQRTKNEIGALPGDIAWVLGACMIARSDSIKSISGFDEDFFLYAEEIDLCLRVRKNGWKIGYVPEAAIIHWGGQSELTATPAAVWRKKIVSEITFYKKHYNRDSLKAISRANILQAYWRILSLSVTIPFLRRKDPSRAKLDKYRIILEMYKNAT